MAVRNIKLSVLYDGSAYHGWQIQPGYNTIQGVLTEAAESLLAAPVRITGASRTDAGVSALAQAASMRIDSPIPTENLARAITQRLPQDIAVSEAIEMPPDFDVISDVKSKMYRYTIFTGPVRPVLDVRHCWHLPKNLDTASMGQAAKMLIGKKDFKSFASAADQRLSSVRTILSCCLAKTDQYIYIDVSGDGFLYNMVRNITGTLVEVGLGRLKPDDINRILEAKNRTAAGPIAPAGGLCLMRIEY